MTLKHNLITGIFVLAFCVTASGDNDDLRARNDAIIVRALERMPGYDYAGDEHVQGAITRHLSRQEGTSEYLKLARKFRPDGISEKLQEMLLGDISDSIKVEAAAMLAESENGPKLLRQMLANENPQEAASVAYTLGLLGNGRAVHMLGEVAGDVERPFDVRRNAVVGLTRNKNGEKSLLELAASGELAADTRMLAGGILARSDDANVRRRAAELLPQPQQKDREPLAPIDQLASIKGNAEAGLKLFRGVATCANCHIVDDHGKEVGPNLSEIGSKLSREAMFTSILDPSAGISHNYESYNVLTVSGQIINGVKISETPNDVVIRTAEAIDRKIPQNEIDQIKKNEKSIMPDNLHHTVDQGGLVDIVQYMTTLKKK